MNVSVNYITSMADAIEMALTINALCFYYTINSFCHSIICWLIIFCGPEAFSHKHHNNIVCLGQSGEPAP